MLTPAVEALIALALEEDLGRGDVTSEAIFAATQMRRRAQIVAKEPLVVAGIAVAAAVFARVDRETRFMPRVEDGERAATRARSSPSSRGARARCLSAERTALNFLQRLSGVATLTRRFVDAVAGTRARIVDTRKTTPGWRALDKAAVRAGGGAQPSRRSGVGRAHQGQPRRRVRRRARGGRAGARAGAALAARRGRGHRAARRSTRRSPPAPTSCCSTTSIPPRWREAVAQIAGRALVEVSGGINLDTVRAFAEAGPDLISVGALTHSARAVDLSLEF